MTTTTAAWPPSAHHRAGHHRAASHAMYRVAGRAHPSRQEAQRHG